MPLPITHSVIPSEDGKYIILTIKGELDSLNALQPAVEAHELAAKLGINQILYDYTEARSVRSPADVYFLINDDVLKQPKFRLHSRVAFLVAPDDMSHDFMITVSQNAGLNVRLFRDRQQAVEYLTQPGRH